MGGELMNAGQLAEELEAINERLHHIEDALRGDLHSLGLITKVSILWKSWVWLLCSASAALGSAVTFLISRLL